MIDVYATAGTFPDTHQLAVDLAAAVMTIEQVPDMIGPSAGRSCQKVLLATEGSNRGDPGVGGAGRCRS